MHMCVHAHPKQVSGNNTVCVSYLLRKKLSKNLTGLRKTRHLTVFGEGNGTLLQYFSWEILWTEEPGGYGP